MKTPDPRALLETLELQYQALAVAHERLAAGEAPAGIRHVAIAPAEMCKRRYTAKAVAPVPAEAPGAWWPRAAAAPQPLKPGPGLPAYGLAGVPLPVVFYDLCGLDEAGIEQAVATVEAAQRGTRAFLPVFLLDRPCFLPLRKRRFTFEYRAPAERLPAMGAGAADYARGFAAFVTAKWAPAQVIHLGPARFDSVVAPAADEGLVIAFPDYARQNPYQRLAYGALPEGRLSYGTLAEAVAVVEQGRRVTFHLHWEDALYRNLRREAWPAAQAAALAELDRLKAAGGRFLWTLHNIEPHDLDGQAARRFMAALAARADALHLHSDWAARQAIELYDADPAKLQVIPHPSYRGLYPAASDRATARAELGLPEGRRVVLMFGNLRGYKGFEEALEALRGSGADLQLVIAGRAGPFDPVADVSDPRVTIIKGYIDEVEVGRLFAAADYALFPFRRISTSGSLLLALTFGVPVIAPAVPALAETVTHGREGLLFDPADPRALARTLSAAAAQDEALRQRQGRAALARAKAFPPERFGRQMAALLERLEQPAATVVELPRRKQAALRVVEPRQSRRSAAPRRRKAAGA